MRRQCRFISFNKCTTLVLHDGIEVRTLALGPSLLALADHRWGVSCWPTFTACAHLVPGQCDFWSLLLANTVENLCLSFLPPIPDSPFLPHHFTMPLTCFTSVFLGRLIVLCHLACSSRWPSQRCLAGHWLNSQHSQTSAYGTFISFLCFKPALRNLRWGIVSSLSFCLKNDPLPFLLPPSASCC